MSEIKLKPREKAHYVSNKDFYAAYLEWYKQIVIAEKEGKESPDMPRFIAECILKICTRLAFRPNFLNYSYRDEMIGDALENCIRVAKNFNPVKSENPFSWHTTVAFNAFLRRIEKEKRESYTKGMLVQQLPLEELMEIPEGEDEETRQYHNQYVEFLREHNYQHHEPKTKKKAAKIAEDEGLSPFME